MYVLVRTRALVLVLAACHPSPSAFEGVEPESSRVAAGPAGPSEPAEPADAATTRAVASDGSQSEDGGRRHPGALEHAFFELVATLDLDLDGHPELLVDEQWPEGLFTWIVRVDPASGELVAQRLCGDAA